MCKGAVSVRAGNLEKMKVHVESDHDVFYDHDILIAINFLESHEKEVIIEKVLPRMKMLLQNMKTQKIKAVDKNKLPIEKRLLEFDAESAMQETVKKGRYEQEIIPGNNISKAREEIDIDDSDEEEKDERVTKKEYSNARPVETLTEISQPSIKNSPDIDTESEFCECDVCHQSVRKSVFEFHRKSHLSTLQDPKMVECPHCKKVMQRTSLWKHKGRCMVLKLSNSISHEETPDHEPEPDTEEKKDVPAIFQCKICFINFPKLASLKWHTTEEHSLDLEDVEEMLNEGSTDTAVKNSGQSPADNNRTNVKAEAGADVVEKDNTGEAAIEARSETEKFKCKYCDDVFTKRNNARRHEKRRHSEIVNRL